MASKKPVLVSAMQPTGRLHIGNYLGALKNHVALQNSGGYRCYFMVADYHSLTENIEDLCEKIFDLEANYLAAGLDPKKSTLFVQSEVPEHTELTWILSTVTPYGDLARMTQFKDKSASQPKNINAGLLTYPILMAVDVLLYDAEIIPVGDDQDQHLELTRMIARRFNKKYGEIFKEPRPLHTKTPRVMSLTSPEKKMSKSEPRGCLFIDDNPQDIEGKIRAAVTDSGSGVAFDEKKKPAVSNLLRIYSGISEEPIKTLEKKFQGMGYAKFKSALAKIIVDHLAPIRERKARLLRKPRDLEKVFAEGSARAQKVAAKKLRTIKKLIYSK